MEFPGAVMSVQMELLQLVHGDLHLVTTQVSALHAAFNQRQGMNIGLCFRARVKAIRGNLEFRNGSASKSLLFRAS